MALEEEAYCIVRGSKDDSRTFLDLSTISGDMETALNSAKITKMELPEWSRQHPTQRITKVLVKELIEEE